ncbi:DUF1638 domain-containing protein [Fontivita pretiosa]|uniref:DUF1638 domain-containing protein n=1 Tax=Fontivita pretiosa TaxID=2989684 RepID=UPI003D181019
MRCVAMLLKLIACNVFVREACWCIAQSPNVIDVEFTELGEHARPQALRELIQSRIDAADASGKSYDAILLLFGLCGNATVGLRARRTQLVMPRAHDCCTILLGSRQKYLEHFADAPSTPFSSCGYIERGQYFLRTADDGTSQVVVGDAYKQLVARYGEEDARFIWEQMHPEHEANRRAVFIELPQTQHLGHAARFAQKAAAEGRQYVHLQGDIRLIRNLIDGQWDPKDYLIVPPNHTIEGVYDHEQVVRVKP